MQRNGNAATIRDVARRAQVSVGTVSRVINKNPSVAPALRRAVEAAVDELKFQPNAVARSLRTSRAHTIGLVVSDLRSSLLARASVWSVESVAQERDYAVLVADSNFNTALEARHITSLIERQVDGLLCAPVRSSRDIYELVRDSGVPTVIFGWVTRNPMLPTALMSETASITEAARHLVEVGHHRVAIVAPSPRGSGGQFRSRLLRDELQRLGVEEDQELDRLVSSRDECRKVVAELLQRPLRPTALITSSSLFPAALTSIRSAGLVIPDTLSVILIGDPEWSEFIDPPLNVIAFDLEAHMRAATQLLFGHIEQRRDVPDYVGNQGKYIRRSSVAAPGISE